MDEEVSEQIKVSIILILTAAALATAVVVWFNSKALMDQVQNNPVVAVQSISVQGLMRLQKSDNRYIDLYKAYEYYEKYINSIVGKDLDGTSHILYLRNADNVNPESDVAKSNIIPSTLTGIQNIDNMYKDFLNQYCNEENSHKYIQIIMTKDKAGIAYDIYYEEVDK